jgi:hypothetical protein
LPEQASQLLLLLNFFFIEDFVDMAVGVIRIATQARNILLLIFLVTNSDRAVCNR